MSAESRRKVSSKRKVQTNSSKSRKKPKTQHRTADGLPWKTVSRPSEAGFGGDDGILELEEVEGVEVIYEDTDGGRVVKFNVLSPENGDEDEDEDEDHGNEIYPHHNTSNTISTETEQPDQVAGDEPFDDVNLLPNWHPYSLHPQLLKTLHLKGFLSPTPIQAKAIPVALAGRDVVGIAETGSGKTLAYGLPILHYLLSQPRPLAKTKRRLRALILAPTRELALQVSSHLNICLNTLPTLKVEADDEQEQDKENERIGGRVDRLPVLPKRAPLVSVAAIVGGMSAQKQRRILDRGVDVLVATPGRLWDIMEDDDELAREVKGLKFLVLDEADRMIEAGHFLELDNILRLTLRQSHDDEIDPQFHARDSNNKEEIIDGLQTFVFSATLSKDLQRNLKKKYRPKGAGKYRKTVKPASTLDDLLLRLDFRDPEPEVIDISPEGGVVSSLKESKIECLSTDKDVYLYYFLLRYPGRSLVFLSSIDGIRRLMPLMELLNVKAFPLHSQLEQRQRLKNLDRFKGTANSVLLATDIAARGLDIAAVDHVIHYQIPRSADAYVHRNGRTARAMRKGFSMLMCAPEERRVVRALLGSLGRQDGEIPEITVELSLLDKLKVRVQIARQVDATQHKIKKENHDRNWMRETAEALEVELDSDFVSDSDEEKPAKQKRKAKNAKNVALKAELSRLLSQPLIARGISTRYITGGSKPIVDDLIGGEYNESMLGLKKAEAGSDLTLVVRKKKIQSHDEEFEEWGGITS